MFDFFRQKVEGIFSQIRSTIRGDDEQKTTTSNNANRSNMSTSSSMSTTTPIATTTPTTFSSSTPSKLSTTANNSRFHSLLSSRLVCSCLLIVVLSGTVVRTRLRISIQVLIALSKSVDSKLVASSSKTMLMYVSVQCSLPCLSFLLSLRSMPLRSSHPPAQCSRLCVVSCCRC